MSRRRQGKSSTRWVREHEQDLFVKRAASEGWRSRAVYKLMEIDRRDALLRPGMSVVELGAAPGGWTEYLAARLAGRGRIVASDILPMEPVADVSFLQGDFTEDAVYERIREAAGPDGAHLVLSDMAPNLSGVAVSDQARAMHLAELALDLAVRVLTRDGRFLVKVFQGAGHDAYMKTLRGTFRDVKVRKPEASRARSREVYVLAGMLL